MAEYKEVEEVYPVFEITFGKRLRFTLHAESFEEAEKQLFAYADDEDEFHWFFNLINQHHVSADPYFSALEDEAFFSSKDHYELKKVTEDEARASRLAYIKKHFRIDDLPILSF